ncbi:hypothetical protein OKA05_20715 [Luteolibacter arcticus]|uniref:HEAT repeat domain-containing protein n=1 Tax=Luteolibacter arcticus TaxID=1581411 RepID=A0ABT3GNA7_9BACT|nr:hypothetical protein [Luteolibacter arcticus]MCW1924998.1 hypothetical protein [Luteolibacter arcticus]
MTPPSRFHATLAGVLLVIATVLIVTLKQAGNTSENETAEPGLKTPPVVRPATPQTSSEEDTARKLLVELSDLRSQHQPVPDDLRIEAEKLINSKRTPYPLRIGLALSACDERWAAKHIQIMFRNEISKRPFETIAELYRLVPEGPLQQQVAESIFQTASLSPADAPAMVAFLEAIPPDPDGRVTSIIGSRLRETKDMETMKALEASSRSEELKARFRWWVTDMEKREGTD